MTFDTSKIKGAYYDGGMKCNVHLCTQAQIYLSTY